MNTCKFCKADHTDELHKYEEEIAPIKAQVLEIFAGQQCRQYHNGIRCTEKPFFALTSIKLDERLLVFMCITHARAFFNALAMDELKELISGIIEKAESSHLPPSLKI